MKKADIERTLWIAAPRERVWQAITDPAQIEQWFSPGTPWELTALETGGKLYVRGYEAQAVTIVTVDPPRQFTYRLESQPPDLPVTTVTTYRLEEENGGTRLNFTEMIAETLPEAARQRRIEDYSKGYQMMLDNLHAYVEGRDLPYPEGL